MAKFLTEDQVRDKAKEILNLGDIPNVNSGVGQITTFNELGFDGIKKKPDGWYLPDNKQDVAVVLETKSEKYELTEKFVKDLQAYIKIVKTKYSKVVGILYNGKDTRVFMGEKEFLKPGSDTLQKISFYTSLYNDTTVDKELIYTLTSRINNSLHFDFGIKNLYHRMIFTACALVAKRFNALMVDGMDYSDFHNSILNSLNKEMRTAKTQNMKLQLLADVFTEIKMNLAVDSDDVAEQEKITKLISNFINWVSQISDNINSDAWRGEDVMGIFFNEFNRYKAKSENGQVFTPEHITDFMYKILDVSESDVVLDAACGTGGFFS
ncbi:TPA: N-6 DNA methylase [Streptococcus suis]